MPSQKSNSYNTMVMQIHIKGPMIITLLKNCFWLNPPKGTADLYVTVAIHAENKIDNKKEECLIVASSFILKVMSLVT